ncbi:MAG: Clp protease ClpP [Bacteroidota bacterium]|nr:Clp protease ClpP [Bacteroidota bacterium]
MPFKDQVNQVKGDSIDIILETPGGLAEIVEDMVHLLRKKFQKVSIIIPGTAKSAGTIFTMAADEILMGSTSALGPIDAQILHNGKRFSADAFLDGLDEIKKEVQASGKLNAAYIPILQSISPAEIQHSKNAQDFSKTLVKKWLSEYKFRTWEKHSSTSKPVTKKEKQTRADTIATALCKHSKWLTHGKSIRLDDLEELRLRITNYESHPTLCDAIERYYTLLQMTFDMTGIYKLYETISSQIYTFTQQDASIQRKPGQKDLDTALIDFKCPKCKVITKIQAAFKKGIPLQKNVVPFPKDNIFICPNCGTKTPLTPLRLDIESKTGKKIIT